MPTRRGWAAFAAGVGFWIASRFVGSQDLHMIAAGILVLPILAALFVQWNRVRLSIHRNLSSARVYQGSRVSASLTVENEGASTAPFLLIEDALPSSLGKAARLVVTGIPPGSKQTVSYSVVARYRGRYTIGPLSIYIIDPFGLARVRIQNPSRTELIVYPEVEDLEPWTLGLQGAGAGESTVRYLHRSAAEFYTMREYVRGDDLRRIHWPSVARTGQLMIRQDESTRRSTATLFLDNRSAALGTNGAPGFERAVSVAASIGRVLIQEGFAIHLAAADAPATPVTGDGLLEALAAASPVRSKSIADALSTLRAAARADTSLVLVTAPPTAPEVNAMSRIGVGFGRKLAVFIYPINPTVVPASAGAELEGRATAAKAALQHAGWDVYVLPPDGRLADVWRPSRTTGKRRAAGSFSS